MKTLFPALATAALLLGALGSAHAQSDSQLWLETAGEYKVSKPLRVTLTGHLRFDDDLSRTAAAMPELGLEYRLTKLFRIASGYRMAYKRNNDGDMELRHRLHGEGVGRYDLGPARLSYRLRYQELFRPQGDNRHTLRNRVKVGYLSDSDWRPYGAGELFHRLGDGDSIRLRTVRITVGTKFDVAKHTVDAFYRTELPQDDPDDPTLHIIGLGFSTGI